MPTRAAASDRLQLDPPVDVVARLRAVRRAYDGDRGEVVALDGVDLDIPTGVVGLLGPNGAGKSTMMRLILGLERPDAGEIEVLGWPTATATLRLRREIGFMPEDDCLFPELRTLEAVVYAARLSGLSPVDATASAHRTLDRVELGGDRYRPASALSLGGRQRLRLAMALVHGPRLLLLDEPTAGLDPEARAAMLGLIAEVGRDGASVLLSTHVLGDVEAICGAVIVVSRGRVSYCGETARFRASAGGSQGPALVAELDRPAAALAQALQAAGVAARAEGLRLFLLDTAVAPEPFWRLLAMDGVGLRRLGPAREAMAEAFVRHLHLGDPERRHGQSLHQAAAASDEGGR